MRWHLKGKNGARARKKRVDAEARIFLLCLFLTVITTLRWKVFEKRTLPEGGHTSQGKTAALSKSFRICWWIVTFYFCRFLPLHRKCKDIQNDQRLIWSWRELPGDSGTATFAAVPTTVAALLQQTITEHITDWLLCLGISEWGHKVWLKWPCIRKGHGWSLLPVEVSIQRSHKFS